MFFSTLYRKKTQMPQGIYFISHLIETLNLNHLKAAQKGKMLVTSRPPTTTEPTKILIFFKRFGVGPDYIGICLFSVMPRKITSLISSFKEVTYIFTSYC